MFRTVAAGSAGGLYVDYSAGVNPGTLITADDKNMTQEELAHAVEAAGWALDSGDSYQLARSIIAISHQVGDVIMPELKLTPVTVSASRSTTNPAYPLYLPIIDRTDADHDISSANAPDLVTAFRAYAANVLGSSSFTASVAGSVLTFANTAVNNALLASLREDGLVQRWLSSAQSATFAASGIDYANWRCINVAGTDYVIVGVDTAARTITVTGSPTAGSQTIIFYPYRIAGTTTSVRLHRLSGFVPVASGDSDGAEISGMRHMDAGQGHWHGAANTSLPITTPRLFTAAAGSGDSVYSLNSDKSALTPTYISDTVNGPPRIGKNFSPRSHSRHAYTWAGRLL